MEIPRGLGSGNCVPLRIGLTALRSGPLDREERPESIRDSRLEVKDAQPPTSSVALLKAEGRSSSEATAERSPSDALLKPSTAKRLE